MFQDKYLISWSLHTCSSEILLSFSSVIVAIFVSNFFICRKTYEKEHNKTKEDIQLFNWWPPLKPHICHFFLHKCTFWAHFFATWKRVNCGKISQNFTKFLKISQNFFTWQFFLHKYNFWYLWQIWALAGYYHNSIYIL